MSEWISVKDKLPKKSDRYLCYVSEINELGIERYIWNCAFSTYNDSWSSNAMPKTVTHWMPLPEAPK